MRRALRTRSAALCVAAGVLLSLVGCRSSDADLGSGTLPSPEPEATVAASLGGAAIDPVGAQTCEDADGTLTIALNDQSAVPKSGYLEAKVDAESGETTWVMIYTYDYQVYVFNKATEPDGEDLVTTTLDGDTLTISGRILENRQTVIVDAKPFEITATCPGL